MPRTAAVVAIATLLSACSTQDLYQVSQGWQKQECQRLQDREERGRCEKSAATSYERYQAEAEAAKKSSK